MPTPPGLRDTQRRAAKALSHMMSRLGRLRASPSNRGDRARRSGRANRGGSSGHGVLHEAAPTLTRTDGVDLSLFALAHLAAYLIRFEGAPPAAQWINCLALIAPFTLVKWGAFRLLRLNRGVWRFTSTRDLLDVVKAAALASLVTVAALLLLHRFHGFSRSVFLLDFMLTIAFTGGARVAVRLLKQRSRPPVPTPRLANRPHSAQPRRCVVLGGGAAGEALVRALLDDPRFEVAALFDDDAALHGLRLHGVTVAGALEDLPDWTAAQRCVAHEAFIALDPAHATSEAMRRALTLCERAGLPSRTVPTLGEIAQGAVTVSSLREVRYRDLLPRETARPERDRIAETLHGARVLVTGAGGSIGSELCRQIAAFEPAALYMAERAESPLYAIQMELAHHRGFAQGVPLLGDIADRDWTRAMLKAHQPHVIYHAAAYKHVPMLEAHPWQAVVNNILATEVLLEAAAEAGAARFLLVSTDKAVNPTSVMGASKRVTELLMQRRREGAMQLSAVRFGNVLGSAGSVLPLFQRQIAHGGPVTVTHPEVTRYFMTVEEACLLILQASAMGRDAEIFLLEMGQPVRILDMARDLIRLSGLEPEIDIPIVFTGLRPGEKLVEELAARDERAYPTQHDQILALRDDAQRAAINDHLLQELAQAAHLQDAERIRQLLHRAAPEYTPKAHA